MKKIDEILKIKELLNSGVITENEFIDLKNKLLENTNAKSKVEIAIDEKECPNCNVILNKDIDKCEYCDYDFISRHVKIEKTILKTDGKSRKKVFIFSIFMLFILFSMWFFVDFIPHKKNSKNETQSQEKNDYNVENLISQKKEIDDLMELKKLSIETKSNYNEDNLANLKFKGNELDFSVYYDSKFHIHLIVEIPRLSMNNGSYSEEHKYYFNSNNEIFSQDSKFIYANFDDNLGEVITKKTTFINYYFENKLVKSNIDFEDKNRKKDMSFNKYKHYSNLAEYIKKTGLKLSFKAN